ncbi:MAG: D-2-hydroxyacid dehydrogenase [Clostridiales bacterium]
MKIVFTDAKTVANQDLTLDSFGEFGELVTYPLTEKKDVPKRVFDADAIICNKTPMNAETLGDAKKLKYIGVLATGYNNVDVDYINSRGITLCNAGGYSTSAVAQHVFAMILHRFSMIGDFADYTKKGEWIKADVFSPLVFPSQEIAGKTLGLVGYGAIAQAVAKIALAFDMQVVVFTRTPKNSKEVDFVDFETMLEKSDIISVHCPLNTESQGLFNAAAFDKCKKNAYFINTARGGVVVEKDLAAALKSATIGGAALDVLDKEPMAADCALIGAPNLLITPHVAWTPLETRKHLLEITKDNLAAYLKGEPQHVIS